MAQNRVHPNSKKQIEQAKDPLDRIIYFFAFAAPIFELPQLFAIYSSHSAKNVSPITWGFFAVASFAWLAYAIRHKLRPIIVSYLLFFVIELMTFLAIMRYR